MENKKEVKFKVGDIVTPDIDMLKKDGIPFRDATYQSIGEVFKVEGYSGNGLVFDRSVASSGNKGWDSRYYKLAKNQIVINILNDL